MIEYHHDLLDVIRFGSITMVGSITMAGSIFSEPITYFISFDSVDGNIIAFLMSIK